MPRGSRRLQALFLITLLVLFGCDDEGTADSDTPVGYSQPSQSDLLRGWIIARQAGISAASPEEDSSPLVPGSNDLSVLGGDANQNQQIFRQRFSLNEPTRDQLTHWEEYDARLTAYSDKDADWQYPTAASANWTGTTWTNGDPLAVEGTTVAVDFNRVPRGSLIYIPALDMYAEANDTGAAELWARTDAGQSDYGANGAGRVDVYNLAGDRSSSQVEKGFQTRVGNNEYGQIYIVYRGSG